MRDARDINFLKHFFIFLHCLREGARGSNAFFLPAALTVGKGFTLLSMGHSAIVSGDV